MSSSPVPQATRDYLRLNPNRQTIPLWQEPSDSGNLHSVPQPVLNNEIRSSMQKALLPKVRYLRGFHFAN